MGQYNRAKAICDRCGFEFYHDQLRKEWTGLLVCAEDFDPPPRQWSKPRIRAEGVPVKNPRPEITVPGGGISYGGAFTADVSGTADSSVTVDTSVVVIAPDGTMVDAYIS